MPPFTLTSFNYGTTRTKTPEKELLISNYLAKKNASAIPQIPFLLFFAFLCYALFHYAHK